jgi:UDP-N-acetyl-D-glucosamine dehydrogenase
MRIGIVGLGYVGLPLGVAFANEGNEVVGLDVTVPLLESLRAGTSHIEDVPDSELTTFRFTFSP